MQEPFTGACEMRGEVITPRRDMLRECVLQGQRAKEFTAAGVYLSSVDLAQGQVSYLEQEVYHVSRITWKG